MKVIGQTNFDSPPERVWEALLDPGVISSCIPGCQEMTEVETDRYAAVLKIGLGPVSGLYHGTLAIRDKEPPTRYVMVFEGSGKQGFVKGAGAARLHGENGATVVSYDCDVEIGGVIASVGQRVLEGVSKFMVNQMFTGLRKRVDQGDGQ